VSAEPIGPGPYRDNLAEFITRFALQGINDPRCADRLGITVAQVRTIRKEYGIEAGEQRWRGGVA
jgi:hypothetical protein